jgi:hypothetical protein
VARSAGFRVHKVFPSVIAASAKFAAVGYRIDFRVDRGILEATVTGGSAYSDAIAREIGEQARLSAADYLLIDIRGVKDRHGRIRSILASKDLPRRVAVVDGWHNDRYYIFAEMAARRAGCDLRRFADSASALGWLRSKTL